MYRDIPRIERHRLVPREVLTHRGWVAGLDRERQFPRHTSHHRGGGEGGALYDNGACRRERRCRCSPKVFRNRREASIRDVPLSLTGNRWRGIVNLIRPGCTMPSNAEKKKIIKPPLMNGLTWPPLSSISRPFCRATRRYHFRVISAQDIFTATRWHTFHAAMYFPNVLFHTFSIKRYITVVLQFLYTFARNGYLRKVILLKGEFKNLKYM